MDDGRLKGYCYCHESHRLLTIASLESLFRNLGMDCDCFDVVCCCGSGSGSGSGWGSLVGCGESSPGETLDPPPSLN